MPMPAPEKKPRKKSRRREIERKKNKLVLAGRVIMVFAGIAGLISTLNKQIKATASTPTPTGPKACFYVGTNDFQTIFDIWQDRFQSRPGDFEFDNSGGPDGDGKKRPIRLPQDMNNIGDYQPGDGLCGKLETPR